MTTLDDFVRIASSDHFLGVVTSTRADGSVQASLVNLGAMPHPVDGGDVVGLVARGDSRKLANLRARPRATAVVHAGWEWVTVEGTAEIVDAGEDLPALLRAVFVAAGGTHDDWDEYDAVMAREHRVAILIRPTRVYSNG
jgi:PPOX class probable F420-dependent enzyme